MNYKRYALRHLHNNPLPTTVRVTAPCPVANVEGSIKRAAADLGYAVNVALTIEDDLASFLVTEREKTGKEERKEALNTFQFPTYSEYVRYTLEGTEKGEPININHFNMPRKHAHAAIRYAAKPNKVRIKKVNGNVSKVTLL